MPAIIKKKRTAKKVTAGKVTSRRPTKPVARGSAKAAKPKQTGGASGQAIADARVLKATGRTTDQWFKILDARAKVNGKHDHKDLAAHLHAEYDCPEWWCQMVTVLYERDRGHRVVGQRTDGFSVNGSRTLSVPIARLYGAWSGTQLTKWFRGEPFTVSKATANRSIRLNQSDGTNVEVMFYEKTTKRGGVKSQVTIQHNKLKSQTAANKMRKSWTDALDGLRVYLEG